MRQSTQSHAGGPRTDAWGSLALPRLELNYGMSLLQGLNASHIYFSKSPWCQQVKVTQSFRAVDKQVFSFNRKPGGYFLCLQSSCGLKSFYRDRHTDGLVVLTLKTITPAPSLH